MKNAQNNKSLKFTGSFDVKTKATKIIHFFKRLPTSTPTPTTPILNSDTVALAVAPARNDMNHAATDSINFIPSMDVFLYPDSPDPNPMVTKNVFTNNRHLFKNLPRSFLPEQGANKRNHNGVVYNKIVYNNLAKNPKPIEPTTASKFILKRRNLNDYFI